MTNIAQTGTTVASTSVGFTYLLDGRIDTITLGSAVTSNYDYNDRGKLGLPP